MTAKALFVMAKRPLPGVTKTRLTPPLSPGEAADLYQCLLSDTLDLVRNVPDVTPFIAFDPPTEEAAAFFARLAPDWERVPQKGRTLGERLAYVLTVSLQTGFDQVVALNSDGPTLPAAYLAQAYVHLDDPAVDVVLGPCSDGGYYLIGWKRPYPCLVQDVQMSTDHVLQDTLAIAQAENLRVRLLPSWYDVDGAADLQRLQTDLAARPQIARHTRRFLAAAAVIPRRSVK